MEEFSITLTYSLIICHFAAVMLGVVTGATDHISYQTQLDFGREALH